MSRRPSVPLVLFILLACFVAGLTSVLLRQRDGSQPVTSSQPDPTSTLSLLVGNTTPSPQTTILVLGVDALDAEPPTLDAIWFVTFRLPGTNLFLFGVPLDAGVESQPSVRLKDLFRWSPAQGPDALFLQALQTRIPLAIDAILVIDRTAFAALVDFMGGVTLESGTLDGRQVIGVYELVQNQPQAALEVQERLVRALADKAPNLGSTPDLSPLMALIPENAYSSIPAIHVIAMISPLLPIESGSVYIEVMPAH